MFWDDFLDIFWICMENFLNPYILFSFSEPLKVLKGTFEGTKKNTDQRLSATAVLNPANLSSELLEIR